LLQRLKDQDPCIGAERAQIDANRGLPGPPLVETTAVTFMILTSESKDLRCIHAGHAVRFDRPGEIQCQKKACIAAGFSLSGTTWTRTWDPMINSHLLAVSRNGATEERGGDLGLLHSVSRMNAARHES
jgi:hypothetical protein